MWPPYSRKENNAVASQGVGINAILVFFSYVVWLAWPQVRSPAMQKHPRIFDEVSNLQQSRGQNNACLDIFPYVSIL